MRRLRAGKIKGNWSWKKERHYNLPLLIFYFSESYMRVQWCVWVVTLHFRVIGKRSKKEKKRGVGESTGSIIPSRWTRVSSPLYKAQNHQGPSPRRGGEWGRPTRSSRESGGGSASTALHHLSQCRARRSPANPAGSCFILSVRDFSDFRLHLVPEARQI